MDFVICLAQKCRFTEVLKRQFMTGIALERHVSWQQSKASIQRKLLSGRRRPQSSHRHTLKICRGCGSYLHICPASKTFTSTTKLDGYARVGKSVKLRNKTSLRHYEFPLANRMRRRRRELQCKRLMGQIKSPHLIWLGNYVMGTEYSTYIRIFTRRLIRK